MRYLLIVLFLGGCGAPAAQSSVTILGSHNYVFTCVYVLPRTTDVGDVSREDK